MQPSVGEIIRQLRRQQSLTQTELGGEHFSKSYVSAVERDKITPSSEALHFFAEQLGQPSDYFVKLMEETEEREQYLSMLQPSNYSNVQGEFLNLLDILLEGTEHRSLPLAHDLPTLSAETIAALPPQRQAHYSLLHGRIAKEKQDFSTALDAFEHALALAPAKHRPAILDELGTCYYLLHAYSMAVGYHERALRLLEESSDNAADLRLKIELHCGNDYRALGISEQACAHYERARQHLSSAHDMRTAGQLYLGLGYCTYACAYEKTTAMLSTASSPSLPEVEREFQHAISYLLQSRTLYQVSGDRMGESTARLLQAMTLLDLCTIRRQAAVEKAKNTDTHPTVNSASFLEEAQEQCRQVLISWQDVAPDMSEPSVELETLVYTALAYLIRALTQSAADARISGYAETAKRESALAAHLCQQVLDTFSAPAFPWSLVRDVVHMPMSSLVYQSPSLPRLPSASSQKEICSPIAQVEVYLTAGEIAEELGRAATAYQYVLDCYRQADRCFRTALTLARSIRPDAEHDPGSLLRYYHRCVSLLEERIQVSTESVQEYVRTLLDIFKIGLFQVQHSLNT